MNLNPFVYSYKRYPESKFATTVNKFCGAMQRMFLLFGILTALIAIFDSVSNRGEALFGAGVMFIIVSLIKFNKDKWSDMIAAKQEETDKLNNPDEK